MPTKLFVLFVSISITVHRFLVSLALLMIIKHLSLVSISSLCHQSSSQMEKVLVSATLRQTKGIQQLSLCYSVTVCNFHTTVAKKNARETMITFLSNVMTCLIRATDVTIISVRKRCLTFAYRCSS